MKYETKAGIVSADDALMQLVEKLREASECAYQVSHIAKHYNNTARGENFRRMGESLEQASQLALRLGTMGGTQ